MKIKPRKEEDGHEIENHEGPEYALLKINQVRTYYPRRKRWG